MKHVKNIKIVVSELDFPSSSSTATMLHKSNIFFLVMPDCLLLLVIKPY
jgi:hypothetical protein